MSTASHNVLKTQLQSEGDQILACYLILIKWPGQLQDVSTETKASEWPNDCGEILGDYGFDLLPWSHRLLCPESSPPLVTCTIEDTKNSLSDLISREIRGRRERSASRREEVCMEWVWSSFFLLFISVKRMCSLASGTTTRDCGGTEAREAFLWKNTLCYVAPDQNSYPGVNNSPCHCIHGGSEAPTGLKEKRGSLSLKPQLAFRTLVLQRFFWTR